MRGKVVSSDKLRKFVRITPACAGKRLLRSGLPGAQKDHPRVCGEKYHRLVVCPQHKGSPPRVRGKVVVVLAVPSPLGITPACAGKRRGPPRGISAKRDHPRVCGEKQGRGETLGAGVGSPPRVRGKEYPPRFSCGRSGITPACAGKSTAGTAAGARTRDHPRVCGEKTKKGPKVRHFFL